MEKKAKGDGAMGFFKKKKEAEIKRLKAENAAKRKALEKQKAQEVS